MAAGAGAGVSRRARRRSARSAWAARGGLARSAWALLGGVGLGGLAVFASSHPWGGAAGTAIGLAFLVALCWRRDSWLIAVPGLLPVIDLAGWTGAIHLTESDALVLAALAVGGFAEAVRPSPRPHGGEWRFGVLQGTLAAALLLSYLMSTAWQPLLDVWRDPALLAGYSTPLNGARLAKGYLWALLLLPLLAAAMRARPERTVRYASAGMVLGLVLAALGALWERLVFTGLSDFASDYRTTALFWEMNVGGATLDGWLALTVPFALWAVLRESRWERLAPLLGVLALAGYAAFTTFSRGLYLGVALGGATTMLLMARAALRRDGMAVAPGKAVGWAAYLLLLGWVFVGVFQSGGYRGLAAMLGLAAAVFAVGPLVAVSSAAGLGAALMLGAVGALGSLAAMWWVPKGVYLAYAFAGLCLVALLSARPTPRWLAFAQVCALACVPWMAASAVLVSEFWSEGHGLLPGTIGALCVLAPLLWVRLKPATCWRPTPATWVRVMLALGAVAAVVVTFNSYYASKRFETVGEDFAGRMVHWTLASDLPQGASEFWLGIGVGEFAERYFWRVPDGMYPGSHRIEQEDSGNRYLLLSGPRHVLGFGELYRVSQRVTPQLEAPFVLALGVRAPEGEVTLHAEICRKHLLYTVECTGREMQVAGGDAWQRVELAFDKEGLGWGGNWLPRLTVFSVANGSRGRRLEVDDLALIDAHGRSLLANGDFTAASDFWFFSSDRHHLPWHAKNLWLHYAVEQGLIGLLAFSALSLAALFRVTFGGAARHMLAPPLAGAMVGFFAVGAFDSLLDAPRLTLLASLMFFMALGLRTSRRQVPPA